jgi:hypothetical protein
MGVGSGGSETRGAAGSRRGLRAAILGGALGMVLIACPSAFAARYTVNSTLDLPAVNPGSHVCQTMVARVCTIRAAIETADDAPGASTVVIPAGHYAITRPPTEQVTKAAVVPDDADNGYFLVTGSITVEGAGVGETVLDGNGLDRLFGVQLGAKALIEDMTITGGDAVQGDISLGSGILQHIDIALGGGILNLGTLTVERVALVRNHADGGGGMFTAPGGSFTVLDSLVAGNTAVEGGGIRADTGGLIENSTITGNSLAPRALAAVLPDQLSGYGGGVDHRGGANLTIINSTITDNHAYKAGGGINSAQDYAPIDQLAPVWPFHLSLRNTIVADNTVGQATENCHVAAMVIESLGDNVSDDGTCSLTAAGDHPRTDPRLAPLANNGGPTETEALLPGSAAIGAGTNCPSSDQRGLPRPATGCDIGAFQSQHSRAVRKRRHVRSGHHKGTRLTKAR